MLETESAVPVTPPAANMATSNASVTDAKRPSTIPAALRDDARMEMEAACVDLICQFESMLTHSVQQRSDGYLSEIVPIVDKSLQIALEFGQTHFIGKPLEVLNRRVLEARECSRSLGNAVSSFEWKTLRRMIGRKSASERDVLRIHDELGTAIAMVLVSALGPAIEILSTRSKSGAEMLNIMRLFVAELRERW